MPALAILAKVQPFSPKVRKGDIKNINLNKELNMTPAHPFLMENLSKMT